MASASASATQCFLSQLLKDKLGRNATIQIVSDNARPEADERLVREKQLQILKWWKAQEHTSDRWGSSHEFYSDNNQKVEAHLRARWGAEPQLLNVRGSMAGSKTTDELPSFPAKLSREDMERSLSDSAGNYVNKLDGSKSWGFNGMAQSAFTLLDTDEFGAVQGGKEECKYCRLLSCTAKAVAISSGSPSSSPVPPRRRASFSRLLSPRSVASPI
jgi:hypothetical protein